MDEETLKKFDEKAQADIDEKGPPPDQLSTSFACERIIAGEASDGDIKQVRDWLDDNAEMRRVAPASAALQEFFDAAPEYRDAALIAAAEAALATVPQPLEAYKMGDYTEADLPDKLIWAEGENKGAFLSRGDIAILAGAGGSGKSTLSLQFGCAMAATEKNNAAKECGLLLRGGPVVFASYEDIPAVVAHRAQKIGDPGGGLHGLKMFGRPLFGPPPGTEGHAMNAEPGPREAWKPFWDYVQNVDPVLVIIDPASAAFVSPSASVEWTRMFLDALRVEAQKIGCGILIIAHSTKAARAGGMKGDPGHVAGSAAWFDAARAVATLLPKRVEGESEKPPELVCAKANYGAPFETIPLQWSGGKWEALEQSRKEAFGERKNGTDNEQEKECF